MCALRRIAQSRFRASDYVRGWCRAQAEPIEQCTSLNVGKDGSIGSGLVIFFVNIGRGETPAIYIRRKAANWPDFRLKEAAKGVEL